VSAPRTGESAAPCGIDTLLEGARRRLSRLTPSEAREAMEAGAVLVDIRPAAQRAIEGEVPGALVVERNVLEWRLDPTSAARLPIASFDVHWILICQQGYASSLAAATLQDIGLRHATDVIGGQTAWRQTLQT
jgi:rhodanese-related sulfurtransferase